VQWTTVVLDCADPASLAAFWAELLDGESTRVSDGFHVVRSGTTWIAAARVADPRPATWPDGDRPKQIFCVSDRIQDYLPVDPGSFQAGS
jgi:hypothetical protein